MTEKPTQPTEPAFTDREIRALEWLPADGSWRDTNGSVSMGGNLESLYRYHDMAELQILNQCVWRGRLTSRGLVARAALPKLREEERRVRIERAAALADDLDFAREVHQHTIPHWSLAWPRINELSRAGFLRVTPINRWMAEVEATEKVIQS